MLTHNEQNDKVIKSFSKKQHKWIKIFFFGKVAFIKQTYYVCKKLIAMVTAPMITIDDLKDLRTKLKVYNTRGWCQDLVELINSKEKTDYERNYVYNVLSREDSSQALRRSIMTYGLTLLENYIKKQNEVINKMEKFNVSNSNEAA